MMQFLDADVTPVLKEYLGDKFSLTGHAKTLEYEKILKLVEYLFHKRDLLSKKPVLEIVLIMKIIVK